MSTELLLKAMLAVLRMAVRSGERDAGFAVICGADAGSRGVGLLVCGEWLVSMRGRVGNDSVDMPTHVVARDMFR